MQTLDSPFTDNKGAAGYLGLSPRTMERDRVVGNGPPFYKFGRRILYKIDDLRRYAEGRKRTSTSDPGGAG